MRFLVLAFTLALLQCCLADDLDRLHAYLQLRTDHGQPGGPDYRGCAKFLNRTINDLLPAATIRQLTYIEGKPVILATIVGSEPSLPSLLLNSHTDVVPADATSWTKGDPYAPSRGGTRVYARGSQDMKSIGLQYVEALGELMESGWSPRRTIHISFVPDEEIGGIDGMGELIQSAEWSGLGVGFALDEGSPHPKSRFNVYVGERQTWWFFATVRGAPGHGATFPEHTATQIAHGILTKALAFRAKQRLRLDNGEDIGDVVGLNVAFLESGVPDANHASGYISNMIPDIARVGFDIRVPPAVKPEDMEAEIASWMLCGDEKCPGVTVQFTNKVKIPFTTDLKSGEWYAKAFFSGLAKAGVKKEQLDIGIFKAATDARFVRKLGVPAVGFSPITETPDLLHKHDEFIQVEGYRKGVRIYMELLKSLADADADVAEGKTEL